MVVQSRAWEEFSEGATPLAHIGPNKFGYNNWETSKELQKMKHAYENNTTYKAWTVQQVQLREVCLESSK
jgi:hypothetical protein